MRMLFILAIAAALTVGDGPNAFQKSPSVSARNPVEAPRETSVIAQIVTESLCYDVYWDGGWGPGNGYRQGIPLSAKILVDGVHFYVRVNAVTLEGPNRRPLSIDRIGVILPRGPVVTMNYDPGMDSIMREAHQTQITIPTDCTPHFDPTTPRKRRMIDAIENTVRHEIAENIRVLGLKYPSPQTLTVADFNIDYPQTRAILEPGFRTPGELFEVSLHDPLNWDDSSVEHGLGTYATNEKRIRLDMQPMVEKIRRHGIVRKIQIQKAGL